LLNSITPYLSYIIESIQSIKRLKSAYVRYLTIKYHMKTVYIERNKLFKDIPMVLCNNIIKVDEGFFEDNSELFWKDCEECEGTGKTQAEPCDECNGEGRFDIEPYQYFIVGVSQWDIERLKEYGVEVGYSNALDVHILPIYDYGTSWSHFSYSKEVEDNYTPASDETLTRTTSY